MPCFHPIQAYRSLTVSANGKRGIVFNPASGFRDLPLKIPCGQCIGCRLERSRQWAVRCIHEASLYSDNCFITLTYNDTHLPDDWSLDLVHFQLFMKRLRKRFGSGIRFFHCGEYGDLTHRPHYHACLFNFDFPDKILYSHKGDIRLYTSLELTDLWPQGFSLIGSVTFDSAAYVARYIMKKVTGDPAAAHYAGRKPEYTTMSRRPGIGSGWLQQFQSEVYPSDEVIINGKAVRPPAYYDTQYEITSPELHRKVLSRRVRESRKHIDNNTPSRLKVRETVTKARLDKLKRNLDESDEI